MKKIILLVIAFSLAATATVVAQEKAGRKDTTTHTILYSCPMHPDIEMYKEGKCPTCGMNLVETKKEVMKREVTKTYTCPVHGDMKSNTAGKCPKCGTKMNLTAKEKMKAEAVKLYTCPMHPAEKSDKAGKCPVCGMELSKS